MCSQAWELEVEDDGQWSEVLAWGVFTDRIVRHLGGDPSRHIAVGVGYGLERLAMLRYGIDDTPEDRGRERSVVPTRSQRARVKCQRLGKVLYLTLDLGLRTSDTSRPGPLT